MSAFEIRTATPDDAPALSGLLDELGFPAAADVVAFRLRALDMAGETTLVITRGGGVMGFVTLHVTPVLHRPTPVGRMTALVVKHDARGQGLGRALVAAAEQRLAAAGCGLVEVTSNQALAGAHAFYERLGYAKTSHRFGKTLPAPRGHS
jgi:predicted N-acetyltransferase YhbS